MAKLPKPKNGVPGYRVKIDIPFAKGSNDYVTRLLALVKEITESPDGRGSDTEIITGIKVHATQDEFLAAKAGEVTP